MYLIEHSENRILRLKETSLDPECLSLANSILRKLLFHEENY